MGKLEKTVKQALSAHNRDAIQLLDIIRDVQEEMGHVPERAVSIIADEMGLSCVDVEGVVTFYHFFSSEPRGKYTVYLNNSAVANMMGRAAIARAFEHEAGIQFGKTSDDGLIGLYDTSCIGMNDQEPAAIINGVIFTNLTQERVREIVSAMRKGRDVREMIKTFGDGNNQSELIRAMVSNNIRKRGQVLLAPHETGSGLKKAVALEPEEVISEMKTANLRGRGGAGFPVGMKWEFCRNEPGPERYVLCNADEGEPGTFKDRVILTEIPEMLFEGMALGGYAVGAAEGILYLRAEYMYLLKHLESVIDDLKKRKMLGRDIAGKKGFNFDIRIKLGAGAYVCGEESALIESAEGKRGAPRNRPPYPAQYGYLGNPSIVNNVETFCCASRIMAEGGEWFAGMGTAQSRGTKLLSVSGDCSNPGVYEIEFGTTVQTLIEEVGGRGAMAVQVGGPSGACIGKNEFGRRICFDDLATGGSIIVIGPDRDLLEIVHNFMDFFVEESCGWCVPCRAGNVILRNRLEKVLEGKGTEADLKELEEWCGIVGSMSRCGLGQTSPNPILTTLRNFRGLYEERLIKGIDYSTQFDLAAAVRESCEASGRKPQTGEQ